MLVESLFTTGPIQINYVETGTPGKPVMVLLHGLTGNWQAYRQDFDVYGEDWHIFALDMRGHGKSSKPAQGYLLPDYAGDIIDFIAQKTGESIVLVGHSLGALVTLAVAASAPDKVRALIANDPPLLGADLKIEDYPGAKMWFSWVYETMEPGPNYEQLLEACKAISPDIGEADLQAMAEQVSGVAPGTVQIALEDRQKDNFDLPAALSHISCPALLLYGDFKAGSVVRDQDAQLFQKLVSHAVVRKIPGGSHMLWWEQADITRGYVQEFLSGIS